MVERFFRDITTERIRNGVFRSVQELTDAIDEYISLHNEAPKPFIWTAKARNPGQAYARQRTVKFQKERSTTLVSLAAAPAARSA